MENSSLGRLFGVLFSPGKTFRSIAERPTWAVALLTLMIVAAGVWYVAGSRMDFRDVITKSVQKSGRDVSPEQLEPQIEVMEKAGRYIYAGSTPLVMAFFTLLTALIYWVAFKLLDSDFSYKSSFSATLHAAMPLVVSYLLSLPVILSRPSLGFQDLKTGTFLASNLAFLAPDDAPAWVTAALASLDFFGLWSLALTIIGFRAVSRKPNQTVAVTVIVVWLIFVGIRVGWTALFS
ncbi:MAG TPA: YIP1 family protein [Thermoanaerobaculia bacterium]|nr:YIP1 family protein [Thermoanaerobaculia bacterium]